MCVDIVSVRFLCFLFVVCVRACCFAGFVLVCLFVVLLFVCVVV